MSEKNKSDWRHRAACLREDPELFFPVGTTGPARLQIAEAKKVCNGCDVREKCLSWSIESGQEWGVSGGMSEDERRALKRRNSRPRVRVCADVGAAATVYTVQIPDTVPAATLEPIATVESQVSHTLDVE